MPGIYLHIPFCVKKCSYCDFVSQEDTSCMEAYAAALQREIKLCSKAYPYRRYDTIFIGGGTPSVMPSALLCGIISNLKCSFDIAPSAEITMEANPGTVDGEKLSACRDAGVNRISFGVQSLDDDILKKIGRIHSRKESLAAISLARDIGFFNISADLMYGLPGQDTAAYLRAVEGVAAAGVTHISAYSLILEEGTPMHAAAKAGLVALPDEDEIWEMEKRGTDRLGELGYERYEISNYAKGGFYCAHNMNYWDNGEYLGLGLNSHSALRIAGAWTRWNNTKDLQNYMDCLQMGRLPVEERTQIGRNEEMFECVMLGLRKVKGISLEGFSARFGTDVQDAYAGAVKTLITKGWLAVQDGRMRLTAIGLDMQNQALLHFLDA